MAEVWLTSFFGRPWSILCDRSLVVATKRGVCALVTALCEKGDQRNMSHITFNVEE